jgi:hypothetical protein
MDEHNLYDVGDKIPVNEDLKQRLAAQFKANKPVRSRRRLIWWIPAVSISLAAVLITVFSIGRGTPVLSAKDLDLVNQTTVLEVTEGNLQYVGDTSAGSVFLSDKGLELSAADGTTRILITASVLRNGSAAQPGSAALSPDGKQVVVDLDGELILVDLASSSRRVLVAGTETTSYAEPVFVNAHEIAAYQITSSVQDGKLVIDNFGGIVTVDVDTGTPHVLAEHGTRPSVTADGATLVYSESGTERPLVKVDLRTGTSTHYGQDDDHAATVSPNGQYVVFLSGKQELVVTDADSFAVRRILSKGDFYDIRWSSDSTSFYLLKFASIEGWSATYLKRFVLGRTDVHDARDVVVKYLNALILHQDDLMKSLWTSISITGPLSTPTGPQPIGYRIDSVREATGKTLVDATITYEYALQPWILVVYRTFSVVQQDSRYLVSAIDDRYLNSALYGQKSVPFHQFLGQGGSISISYEDDPWKAIFTWTGAFDEQVMRETGKHITGWGVSAKWGDDANRSTGATPLDPKGWHVTTVCYDTDAGWLVFALQGVDPLAYRLYTAKVNNQNLPVTSARFIGGAAAYAQTVTMNEDGRVLVSSSHLPANPIPSSVVLSFEVYDLGTGTAVDIDRSALDQLCRKTGTSPFMAFWQGQKVGVQLVRQLSDATVTSQIVTVDIATGAVNAGETSP